MFDADGSAAAGDTPPLEWDSFSHPQVLAGNTEIMHPTHHSDSDDGSDPSDSDADEDEDEDEVEE